MNNVRVEDRAGAKRGRCVTLAVALAVTGCGGAVQGPPLQGSESLQIGPGFQPDPFVVSGYAGGPVDARQFGADCRGFVTSAPSFEFDVTNHIPNLRVVARADQQDITLAVQAPDGQFVCNDDAEARNPVVSAAFAPGHYRVWVGAYQRSGGDNYLLGISQGPTLMPSHLNAPTGGGLGTGTAPPPSALQGNQISLAPGFTPSAFTVDGVASGQVPANAMNSDCQFYVGTTPTFVFNATGHFAVLRIMADGANNGDTAIAVRAAGGQTVCNDDFENNDPLVQGAFAPGTYEIFVGTYQQNASVPYRLGITEQPTINPSALAAMGASAQVAGTPPGPGIQPGTQPGTPGALLGGAPLAEGFLPDPATITGSVTTSVAATTMGRSCRGWITAAPNHEFTIAPPQRLIHIGVSSRTDGVLVVQGPNGTVCDDDGGGGHNPLLSGQLPPGTYRVWVGTFQRGTMDYTLGVSERPSMNVASLGNTNAAPPQNASGTFGAAPQNPPPGSREGNFPAASLAPGFTPDPHMVYGLSGGGTRAATWRGGCQGFVTENAPNHVFTAEQDFPQLSVGVHSAQDATLVIEGPDGTVLCSDDDGDNTDPLIRARFPAGEYRIWVGSYAPSQNHDYALGFSEGSIRTATLD